ncbi:hypothetical protein [Paraburkholderia polaris]|uniref:hypothetical protein n=1 Tax=Paraburkholderia polaris TaxID=2728848 RepID=UPI002E335A61|nr:hypothetical protein [Paraburkholderia polaris]
MVFALQFQTAEIRLPDIKGQARGAIRGAYPVKKRTYRSEPLHPIAGGLVRTRQRAAHRVIVDDEDKRIGFSRDIYRDLSFSGASPAGNVIYRSRLFLSSFSNGKRTTVGQAFTWEPLERAAFGNFEQDVI